MSKYLGICRIITRGTVTFAPIVPGVTGRERSMGALVER